MGSLFKRMGILLLHIPMLYMYLAKRLFCVIPLVYEDFLDSLNRKLEEVEEKA